MGKDRKEDVILQGTVQDFPYFILRLFNDAILTAGIKTFREMVSRKGF
jgi:hypothetical protein